MISLAIGFVAVIGLAYLSPNKAKPSPERPLAVRYLTETVFVAEQIGVTDLAAIKIQNFDVIVDFRPDGEVSDQTPSTMISNAALQYGIKFYYIPVSHGTVSADAVSKLQGVLSQKNNKTLIYCRSGNRATKTYALALASEQDGPDLELILKMIANAGHSANDIKEEITRRIGERRGVHE
jgi:uncharacterized protein (TIGR01244 family)